MKIIEHGPFKGRRIEMAPQTGIEAHQDVAEDFMKKILEMELDDVLLTDESSLLDFVDWGNARTRAVRAEGLYQYIQEQYGLDVRDIKGGNLLEIFARIKALPVKQE